MKEATRTLLGYIVVGLAIGLFLHPWLYIYLTRTRVATVGDPIWVAVFFALIALPALLLAFVGMNKAKAASPPV